MKSLLFATVAGAALLVGASAAGAQTYYDPGYAYSGGPFIERGVGLQVGPVGVGVYADQPAYDYGYRYGYGYRQSWPRDNSVYESNSFRATEFYPQSPPGGGY